MAVGTCMDLATIRKSRWIPKYYRTRGWSGSLHFLKVVRYSCVHGHEPSSFKALRRLRRRTASNFENCLVIWNA